METKLQIKKCPHCGYDLEKIVYTRVMSEEWAWNGDNWECLGHHSLTDDPEQNVFCPECDNIIGTGLDFGFGKGTKS